jgi:hypothetical protein
MYVARCRCLLPPLLPCRGPLMLPRDSAEPPPVKARRLTSVWGRGRATGRVSEPRNDEPRVGGQCTSGHGGAAGGLLQSGRRREQAPQIRQLATAIATVRKAEHLRAQAEAKLARGLQLYRSALPNVESMLAGANEALIEHASAVPAQRASHAAASRDSTQAATRVRNVLHRGGDGDSAQLCITAVQRAGSQLLHAARVVDHQLEQLHTTLAATSAEGNSKACLALRILGVDAVRAAVFVHLSLRQMLAVRRVCHDFDQWSREEAAPLMPMPLFSQRYRHRESYNELIHANSISFGNGGVFLAQSLGGFLPCYQMSNETTVPAAPDDAQSQNSAAASTKHELLSVLSGVATSRSSHGCYMVGGERKLLGDKPWETDHWRDTEYLTCACVWRPAAHGHGKGGRWHSLPPLPAGRADAQVCAVTMPEGDEVVVVIGGRTADSPRGCAGVLMLRHGAWNELAPLRSSRFHFTACALPPGRVAIAGGVAGARRFSFNNPAVDTVEVLDVSRNLWSDLPRMRHTRTAANMVACGEMLTVLGGVTNGASPLARGVTVVTCEQLLPGADSWTEMHDIPTGVMQQDYSSLLPGNLVRGGALVKGSIVLTTLEEASRRGYAARVHIYCPDSRRWFTSEKIKERSYGSVSDLRI